jgi:hypothetical protein
MHTTVGLKKRIYLVVGGRGVEGARLVGTTCSNVHKNPTVAHVDRGP